MQIIIKILKFLVVSLFIEFEFPFSSNCLKKDVVESNIKIESFEHVNEIGNIEFDENSENDETYVENDEKKQNFNDTSFSFSKNKEYNIESNNSSITNFETNESTSENAKENNENKQQIIEQSDNENQVDSNINENVNTEKQNNQFVNSNSVNYNIYSTEQECVDAGLEIAFKDTSDIINTFCFSVAENGKLIGFRLDINCKSENCDKYR